MNSQMQFPAAMPPSVQSARDSYAGDPEPFRPSGFSDAFAQVKRRTRLVLTCVGAGAALALFAAFFLMPHYTAKALLLVNQSDAGDARRADEGAIDMHVALLTSRAHLDHVLAEMEKDPDLRGRFSRAADIERRLKVLQELRSRLIGVNFTARSPQIAAKVANDVARLYVDESQTVGDIEAQNTARQIARQIGDAESQLEAAQSDLRGIESSSASDSAAREALSQRVEFWRQQVARLRLQQDLTQRQEELRKQRAALDPDIRLYALAQPPEQPSSIRPIAIVIPAVIASALFGIALAVLLGRLDQRIHNVGDLRRAFSIPCFDAASPKPVQSRIAGGSCDEEEALEAIAASVFLTANARSRLLVMVSSVDPSPACDFVFDFAIAASRLKRTLLVDLVNRAGGMSSEWRRLDADANRQLPLDLGYISLVPEGTNLLSLAATGALAETLMRLKNDYDWIILAAPPVPASPASRIVAGMADKVILTVTADATVYSDVAEALKQLATPDDDWGRPRSQPQLAFVVTDLRKEMQPSMPLRTATACVDGHSLDLSPEGAGGPADCADQQPKEPVSPDDKKASATGETE